MKKIFLFVLFASHILSAMEDNQPTLSPHKPNFIQRIAKACNVNPRDALKAGILLSGSFLLGSHFSKKVDIGDPQHDFNSSKEIKKTPINLGPLKNWSIGKTIALPFYAATTTKTFDNIATKLPGQHIYSFACPHKQECKGICNACIGKKEFAIMPSKLVVPIYQFFLKKIPNQEEQLKKRLIQDLSNQEEQSNSNISITTHASTSNQNHYKRKRSFNEKVLYLKAEEKKEEERKKEEADRNEQELKEIFYNSLEIAKEVSIGFTASQITERIMQSHYYKAIINKTPFGCPNLACKGVCNDCKFTYFVMKNLINFGLSCGLNSAINFALPKSDEKSQQTNN